MEPNSIIIVSLSNLVIPLGQPKDPPGTEAFVPSALWENQHLPNTVAPTFTTCNISRKYELEVIVGVGHGLSSQEISVPPPFF